MFRSRVFVAALSSAALCAAVPASAGAATVGVSGATLSFVAGANEANALTVERLSTGYRITDAGAPLTAGAGCTAAGPHAATCGLGSVALVRATLGVEDDTARIAGSTPAAVDGGPGTDELTGGSGRDTLDAGTGDFDRVTGGAGADRLVADRAKVGVVLLGGPDADTLVGNPNAQETPSSFYGIHARMDGGPGNDTLDGSSAEDVLDGGTGADTIRGGFGVDVVSYATRTEPVAVDLSDADADDGGALDDGVVGGVSRRDLVTGVETVDGGSGDDVLTARPEGSRLAGAGGDDTLNGGGGADTLCGDGPAMSSSQSVYSYYCYPARDGAAGDDALNGGSGNDWLEGSGGADRLNGGTGRDTVTWEGSSGDLVATIDDRCGGVRCAAANDGAVDADPSTAGPQPEGDRLGLDVEDLIGGHGHDTLTGSAAANRLSGGAGSDTLTGAGGNDTLCGDGTVPSHSAQPLQCGGSYDPDPRAGKDSLDGGDGDDALSGGWGADVLTGGAGADLVSYADRSKSLLVTIDDTCVSSTGARFACARPNDGATDVAPATPGNQSEGDKVGTDIENLVGGYATDTLGGGASANVLDGGSGSDTLNGLAGADLLLPGPAGYNGGDANVLSGGGGFDYVSYRGGSGYTGVTVSIDGVANDGGPGSSDNVKTDVEGVIGSSGDDVITGNPRFPAGESLLGYGGDDRLDGNGGNDALTGGAGADTLTGDGGDDSLDSADGEADSTVVCGAGADRVVFDTSLEAPSDCETESPVGARR